MLSWASLYAYLSERTKAPVARVQFLIDLKADGGASLRMKLNDQEAVCPLDYRQMEPVIKGYVEAQDLQGVDVFGGDIDIDYQANKAAITVYYHDANGQPLRREQTYNF